MNRKSLSFLINTLIGILLFSLSVFGLFMAAAIGAIDNLFN
jgi:hypothetical protein